MANSATTTSELVVHRSEAGNVGPSVTSQARWMGVAILAAAGTLALAAAVAGLIFTAPAASLCPPPSGSGPDVSCPPGPLTTDNMFALLTLVVVSLVLFALGVVVEMMVWFRANPTE